MRRFRIWLEGLDAKNKAQAQNLFDKTLTTLQVTRDDFNKSLGDLKMDGEASTPNLQRKGSSGVLNKLNGILTQMKQNDGDPESKTRAENTMKWLGTGANDQKVGPAPTVGELLKQMFGNDFYSQFVDRNAVKIEVPQQKPQNQNTPGGDATSAPFSQQQAAPPPQPAGNMPAPPAGPMGAAPPPGPMPGAPMPDPSMMGGDPMAAMMGGGVPPTDPTMPTTPGGPMPPMPPGMM